jgi:hypothetical protein
MIDLPAEILTATLAGVPVSTLILCAMVLGRAYAAARKGGGLVGIWRGLMFGENVPPQAPTRGEPGDSPQP